MTSTATGSSSASSATRRRTPARPATSGSMLQASGPNAGLPTGDFAQFGRPPNSTQLAVTNSFCGRTENSSVLHQQYCDAAGQNLMSGWNTRRNEWQFGLGVQHEILPRLSGEVTFNHRKYSNLTDSDTVGRGCDYFLGADPKDRKSVV